MTSPTQDVCLRTLGMTAIKMKAHASSFCEETYLFLMVSLSCLVDIALVHSLYYEKQSYYCKFN